MWLGEELHWYLYLSRHNEEKTFDSCWVSCRIQISAEIPVELISMDKTWDQDSRNPPLRCLRHICLHCSSCFIPGCHFHVPPDPPSLIPVRPFVMLGTISSGEKQWDCRSWLNESMKSLYFLASACSLQVLMGKEEVYVYGIWRFGLWHRIIEL